MKIYFHRSLLFVGLLIVGAFLASTPAEDLWAQDAPPTKAASVPVVKDSTRHALLIGCTTYYHLPSKLHLKGPANDVKLMVDFLARSYQFGDVVTLSEEEGKNNKDRLPTRANIERQFVRLAQEVQHGHRVVILLSGHGSQQPEKDPPPDPKFAEPDGMDEIFLPADIDSWESTQKTVANAIIDDDIREWTTAIVDKGASLWLIADCCHSGDLLRGTDVEVSREVKPDELRIPEKEIQQAHERAKQREQQRGEPQRRLRAPHLVAIYAARTSEVTIERPMGGGKSYGLLTYTLRSVLEQANQSKQVLSYRGLVNRINAEYRGMNRSFPMPLVDGPDADTVVLGLEKAAGHPFKLQEAERGYKIDGGLVHGLTVGTILAVFPDHVSDGKPVGHVKITKVGTVESEVKNEAYAGLGEADLTDGGACEPVYIPYTSLKLKVAADGKAASGALGPIANPPVTVGRIATNPSYRPDAKSRERLQAELEKIAAAGKEQPWIEVVSDPRQAEWLVRAEGNDVFLLPAEGVPLSQKPRPLPAKELGEEIKQRLGRVARARNLLQLASPSGPGQSDSRVKLDIRMKRFKDEVDRTGITVDYENTPVSLYAGDLVRFHVHNPNPFGIYATVLMVDGAYGIASFYPEEGVTNLKALGPDRGVDLDLRVNDDTLGVEHLVVIAVKDPGYPVDFRMLSQEGVRGSPDANTLRSPLGQLIETALYAQGNTRGAARRDFGDHRLRTISWTTLAGKRSGG
jgi:hypothetical protein